MRVCQFRHFGNRSRSAGTSGRNYLSILPEQARSVKPSNGPKWLFLQQLAGDDHALDLAGAFADGAELYVAIELLRGIVLDEPIAAVDLHAFVGTAHCDFAGEQLRHG